MGLVSLMVRTKEVFCFGAEGMGKLVFAALVVVSAGSRVFGLTAGPEWEGMKPE